MGTCSISELVGTAVVTGQRIVFDSSSLSPTFAPQDIKERYWQEMATALKNECFATIKEIVWEAHFYFKGQQGEEMMRRVQERRVNLKAREAEFWHCVKHIQAYPGAQRIIKSHQDYCRKTDIKLAALACLLARDKPTMMISADKRLNDVVQDMLDSNKPPFAIKQLEVYTLNLHTANFARYSEDRLPIYDRPRYAGWSSSGKSVLPITIAPAGA